MASRIFADISTASKCAGLFPTTVASCQEAATAAKARAVAILDRVLSIENKDRTFCNTADATDIAAAELSITSSALSVLSQVSTCKEIRDEANKLLVDLRSFSIDSFESNRALFKAYKAVSESEGYKAEYLDGNKDPEYKYWLSEELDDYRRRGMDLPEEQFQEVVQLQKDLSQLSTIFSQNISEDKTELHFSEEGLKGVPDAIIKALKKTDEGKLIAKMDYPTYFGVMKNCEITATRQTMARAFNNRAYPINESVLRDIIAKRHQLATKLGYPSFAHLYISDKMAKTPATAQNFVDGLAPKLQKKWVAEAELLKKHMHPSCVLTAKGEIESFDITFMMEKIKETLLNVNETAIQEYFPADAAIAGIFDIYRSFFGVSVTQVEHNGELWHPEAMIVEIKDTASGTLLGHMIFDLYPREGKYSHACCHSVVPPVRLQGSETEFSPALAVIVANFPAATADRPALFLHDDAQTLLHEQGHGWHSLLGRSKMATFAGPRVKRDFVELPSQMIEEWLWEPSILQKVTRHYITGEPLPAELIAAKVKSRNAFSGRDSLRQLQFATYSLEIFGLPFSTQERDQLDTTGLFYEIEPRILPGMKYDRESHFEAAFGHLTGYGAGYYGYMWSKVFALDAFGYIRDHDGLLNPKVGRHYIDCIIGVGGGQDPNDMLRKFLGREPNFDAFLYSVGIE